jgi:hypothetical protein
MSDPVPIFDFTGQFDTTLPIGDHAVPVHIKRFSRAEMDAFEQQWATYIVEPRGSDIVEIVRRQAAIAPKDGAMVLSTIEVSAMLARVDCAPETPRADEVAAQFNAETLRFVEATIGQALTLDDGLIRDQGVWVTDGAGFIRVFHARKDVLVGAVTAICHQNRLSDVLRKNSHSPRASEPGSAQSNPARGGDGQGPTAGSAERSNTAASADAMEQSHQPEVDAPASSGVIPAVH